METRLLSPININDDNDGDDSIEEMEANLPQSQTSDTKRKHAGPRKRKLKSEVWKHFTFLERKTEEPLTVKCNKCGQKYSGDSTYGTGNLKRHLEKCLYTTTREIGQYLLSSDHSSVLTTRSVKFNQEKFRELLVHAIIRHDLPFSFVEYEGVRKIWSYLEPQATHITRNTAKADIKKLHASQVDRLRVELNACPSRICLTSDAWSSIVTDGYMSLTAHYIDSNWMLQKKILNFSYMPPPHNGVAFAEKIHSLVSGWGIEKKLFAMTLDNASVNDVCVEILKDELRLKNALVHDGLLFHVRCCAHILNLIVQDGIKEIDVAVDKIRECVKYVKGSQVRKQRFIKCVQQKSLDSKRALVQDVPTRWNSTYKMLSSVLYYRIAFCHLQLSDSNFKSCPSSEEWEKVQKICNFLKVFYDATNTFSGSYYPTANLYFPQVFLVQLKLVEESSSPDGFMKKIAEQMFVKFNKYWSEFNLLLAMAVVFDPRYKFQFLEFSYSKLYGFGSDELARVKSTLFRLFDEYSALSKIDASSSHSHGNAEYRVIGSNDVENQQVMDVFKEFDKFESLEYAADAQKNQLELYLAEPRSERTSTIQVLDFWKSQQYRYPDLAKLARDVLCVPISTVASESAFSSGGRVLDQFRSTLSPQIVEALICSKDWLFGEKEISAFPVDEIVQDILATNLNQIEDEVEGGASNNTSQM